MINIAVMGYGTIGSGVVEVINTNGSSIAGRVGEPLNVKYVLDLRDFPGDPIQEKIVHDVQVILDDPEVAIVVETMGGTNPVSYTHLIYIGGGQIIHNANKATGVKVSSVDYASPVHYGRYIN